MKRNIAFRAKCPRLPKQRAHSCPNFVVVATLLALWLTTPINGVAKGFMTCTCRRLRLTDENRSLH